MSGYLITGVCLDGSARLAGVNDRQGLLVVFDGVVTGAGHGDRPVPGVSPGAGHLMPGHGAGGRRSLGVQTGGGGAAGLVLDDDRAVRSGSRVRCGSCDAALSGGGQVGDCDGERLWRTGIRFSPLPTDARARNPLRVIVTNCPSKVT